MPEVQQFGRVNARQPTVIPLGTYFLYYHTTRTGLEVNREMHAGKVKWFNDKKGFGFIEPDGGGEDIFVHHTSIMSDGFRTLAEGQNVQFEVIRGPKGMQATNVQKAV